MKTISIQQFCTHYNVYESFIDSLITYELIEFVELETTKHIQIEDINTIERLIRMHYDLNVNFEGLDIINNLINQINALREEVSVLKNKIDFYE
ncbi:MAG TPA: hypothetical protein DDZ39_05935 [Flavobacteriaceae bacterium]|jgi:signal transduction histidine kinase|nr:hypothetical protein [Flavobacteriaceae bacterium]HBS13200.1 hypothetical protein [Flavobacteriaceae bacterium]